MYNLDDVDAMSKSRKFENNMDEREKKSPVSNVGPVNECLTSFEEPECSDTKLIACMEVVEKNRRREKNCSFCNTKQR